MSKGRLARVKTKLIDPGERARKDYNNIPSLAEDIQTRGLIHPIAVMDTGDGLYLLLAGGRRLAACQHLDKKEIDCKIFPSTLTTLEIKSIELMENIQRENLTFYEEVNLEREILHLQQEIHGEKISTSPDAPGVSRSDVADMIGISREKLRQDIDLADMMEKIPEAGWDKMKNRAEALKLKNNIGKMVVRQDAIKRFDEETGGNRGKDKLIKQLADSFVHGDFFEFVKQLPDNSIDLVEIDPPYAINLGKIKKADNDVGSYSYGETGYNEIDPQDYPSFMLRTFKECYRVMKPNSFMICWFSPDPWFGLMLDWLKAAKLKVRGLPCVWVKGVEDETGMPTGIYGQTNSPMRHLASTFEMFFYAKKGDPKIVKQGRPNSFSFKTVPPTQKIHPTERPIELIQEILQTFTEPGSKILVPFLGSGTTILAAHESKMKAFGTDLGEEHKEAFVAKLIDTYRN